MRSLARRTASSSRPRWRGVRFSGLAFFVSVASIIFPTPLLAQNASSDAGHVDAPEDLRLTLQGGVNAVAERNLYWNLADRFAPSANFDSDTEWLEAYLKPGIEAERRSGDSFTLYGRLSAVASATVGTDAFSRGDTGRVGLEEAYVGVRLGGKDAGEIDLSLGARELKLGTGMLVANGASNGFERGAVKLGPRKAWARSAIASFSKGPWTAKAFFLDPNELPSNDTRTRLAGGDVRANWANDDFAGLTLLKVLNSGAPYPQAAPGGAGPPAILEGARKGLKAISLYARIHPLGTKAPGLFVAIDGAREWNDRVALRAWGGRVQVGHAWKQSRWRPELIYSFQRFSGDDPDTPRLERFDPLYYEGSPASWATGSKSALVFINSNVRAHQLTLKLMPSPKDFLTLRAAHIAADRLRSPIQFGQATRLDIAPGVGSVITGVTRRALADDVFVEYTRLLNRNIFLTGGFSLSAPGKGIKVASGGDAPAWTGGFVNVVFSY